MKRFDQSLCVTALVASVLAFGASVVHAISPDNAPAEDNSVESEQASFELHEDFEVSLFADETLGIANPVALQWDPSGRLWVLCTLAYAQLKPGELPDDKLIVLEDTDGDGRADQSKVFADGLNMPMGFALGHGGVYLAQDTDLLFLKDTDGDGVADSRKILLTGFGTGDTHQNISNLVFDAGGFLYFTQGLHAFSHVETPWGVSRGDSAGFWRFDPRTTRLHPFCFPSMAGQNPVGAALDRGGALFIKSNGPHLCFATPGLIPTTHYRELMVAHQVGQTPGKSMGVDIVESAHLPEWAQGNAIISGYFAREVSAIPLVEDGAGFAVSPPVRLLFSRHPSFRPVDTRQGPDGAIYVADWFNPIINHYQVSLRHPDRDYTHGRIWRLSAKGRAVAERPPLESMGIEALCEQLLSEERWIRTQAGRRLSDHPDTEAVVAAIHGFLKELGRKSVADPLAQVEAAGILESLGRVNPLLIYRLRASAEPHVRSLAARILGRLEPVLVDDYESLDVVKCLEDLARDPDPRPRLETIVACANLKFPGATRIVLLARSGSPDDKAIDYAASQALFALEDEFRDSKWIEHVPGTEMTSAEIEEKVGSISGLIFWLETTQRTEGLPLIRDLLAASDLKDSDRTQLLEFLGEFGTSSDLNEVLRASVESDSPLRLLESMEAAWTSRKTRPDTGISPWLERVMASSFDLGTIRKAVELSGFWKSDDCVPFLMSLVNDEAETGNGTIRSAAMLALARIRGSGVIESLEEVVKDPGEPLDQRKGALLALVEADVKAGAALAASLLDHPDKEIPASAILEPFLARGGGIDALAQAFENPSISEPDQAVARELLTRLNEAGQRDSALSPLLNSVLGIETGAPAYDADRVRDLVAAIQGGKGNAEKGLEIYRRAELSCVACHRIGEAGGVIGPPLTNVGAGMPLDQIIESVLWPDRQIKEGYQAVNLTTHEGKVITGYLEREGEDVLFYRNTTAPWILPLEKKNIKERKKMPTLMPPGLTRSLTDAELIDLITYLASLQG